MSALYKIRLVLLAVKDLPVHGSVCRCDADISYYSFFPKFKQVFSTMSIPFLYVSRALRAGSAASAAAVALPTAAYLSTSADVSLKRSAKLTFTDR